MGAKETSEYRRRRKENLIKVCGGKCALCGYNRLPDALDFHHIDPSQKSYGIASGGTCHDLEADLKEVKKCLLVCSNCHREIHAGLYLIEELIEKQVFLEEVAESLREDKYFRTGTKVYHCENCGCEITKYSKSGLCDKCVKESKRTVERPSREELKALIRSTPFTKIGEHFGVSDNTIRKWCKAEGLPSKVVDIKKYSVQEWEEL